MSEAATPDAGNGTTAPALDSAQDIFAHLETADIPEDEAPVEEEPEDPDADAKPQGDPKPEDGEADDKPKGEDDDEPDDDESEKEEPKTGKADDNATVDLDGKAVTVAELKKGYLREADYTRKTQEVARDRGEMDSAVARLEQFDTNTRQRLTLAESVLSQILPPAPDPSLIHSDPVAYLQQKEQREAVLGVIGQIQQVNQTAEKSKGEALNTQSANAIKNEIQDLQKRVPEFAKPEAVAAFQREAVDLGAKYYGFSEGEILGIRSAKELHALRDAIEYRKLQAKQAIVAAKVDAAKPLSKPGARVPSKSGDRLSKLRALGSSNDAAEIFAGLERLG